MLSEHRLESLRWRAGDKLSHTKHTKIPSACHKISRGVDGVMSHNSYGAHPYHKGNSLGAIGNYGVKWSIHCAMFAPDTTAQ